MSRYFWPFLTPLIPVTLCHTSRDPPKVRPTSRTPHHIFSRPSKTPDKIVRRVFSGGFSLESFVRGWFLSVPLRSEYFCYNRKLNITLNFRFHMYDTKIISVTSQALDPSPCHKLSHHLGPPPLERDVLYGRPLNGTPHYATYKPRPNSIGYGRGETEQQIDA